MEKSLLSFSGTMCRVKRDFVGSNGEYPVDWGQRHHLDVVDVQVGQHVTVAFGQRVVLGDDPIGWHDEFVPDSEEDAALAEASNALNGLVTFEWSGVRRIVESDWGTREDVARAAKEAARMCGWNRAQFGGGKYAAWFERQQQKAAIETEMRGGAGFDFGTKIQM